MIGIEICIDVPDLSRGVRFYEDAFGFTKISEPYPGVVVLQIGATAITLLEKPEQSKPTPTTRDVRHYDRHWTPVHLDFHVDDLRAALAKAMKAGALQEQLFEDPQHGSIAFCADPFGNGFCILQSKGNKAL